MNTLPQKHLFLVAMMLMLLIDCKTGPVKTQSSPLNVAVEDISCTEVYLKISLDNSESERTITIQRFDSTIASIKMTGDDSLFIDSGLFPKTMYTYTVYSSENNATLQTETMDTSSHNISWSMQTIGDGNASVLHDVAILNDTLAYAVGEIFLRQGNAYDDRYNFAEWNGVVWQLKRVSVPFNGTTVTPAIRGIYAFSPSQIWLCADLPIYGDGTHWALHDVRSIPGMDSVSFQRCWGPNPENMYFVGMAGSIGQYLKGVWKRIEGGTRTNIRDIAGGFEPKKGEPFAICTAHMSMQNDNPMLLQLKGGIASKLPDSGLTIHREAVWFSAEKKYYLVGDGIYSKRLKEDLQPWIKTPGGVSTDYYAKAIDGTSINNVFVAGSLGVVTHFNGLSWKKYLETYIDGECRSISVKNDLVISVGAVGTRGFVAIGKRQK